MEKGIKIQVSRGHISRGMSQITACLESLGRFLNPVKLTTLYRHQNSNPVLGPGCSENLTLLIKRIYFYGD